MKIPKALVVPAAIIVGVLFLIWLLAWNFEAQKIRTNEEKARAAKKAAWFNKEAYRELAAERARADQERKQWLAAAEARRQQQDAATGYQALAELDKGVAYARAKEFVKDRLKAPGTAKFPDGFWGTSDEAVAYLGDRTYFVRSHVDAENSFGAKMRIEFGVKLKKSDTGRWQLLDISMQQR